MCIGFLHDEGYIETGNRPDYGDQIFNHLDEDGTVRRFHIRKLELLRNQRPEDWALERFPITKNTVKHVMRSQGVVEKHARSLSLARAEEPGIVVRFPDHTTLIIDGNHRLVKRYLLKHKFMDFWTCTRPVWRLALLDDESPNLAMDD